MKKKALITGLTGFTGRYLAAELRAAGYDVYGTGLRTRKDHDQLLRVDLRDISSLREAVNAVSPDVVAHLAAVSFVAHGDVEEIYQTNIVGTRNLLQTLTELEKEPQSVLLASSANVYGNANVDLISEDTPLSPANDYAVSKLAMEKMAALWADRLPLFITRPFNYVGVGQALHFLLPKIVSHFQQRLATIELGNTNVSRDFSDVRVVAKAYRQLLELAPVGQTINICSGVATSLETIIQMMETIAGYKIDVQINPAFVRQNEIKQLRGSNQLLTTLLGQTQQIPLEETLTWMYAGNKNL